ncbi:MAG: Tetratricopeptide repeat protein [Bacteroidetes bacterium ADurb.Bin408]|nr:MAG: Tetratricopeptide repeat protein [Bacteroidetes bacterium ADurb.Bin408]
MHLLTELILEAETQIAERAFTGLMFALYIHDRRLKYYPETEKIIAALKGHVFTRFFIIQVIKAQDTEKFSKKFREEIMPDIIKHAPKIQDKLELDDILPDNGEDEKNPKWRQILNENPDLMDKLEELSKLQMEGTDVFMSTFAMLKNFSFFKTMPHWFLPFYKENNMVASVLAEEDEDFRMTFLEALEKSGHMCNSDKYSFCLNVKDLPATQKKVMLQMFKQELESINEVNEDDDLLNRSLLSKRIITAYIQDLYRFFKLYREKNEFDDIFSYKLDFYNKEFFQKYFADNDLLVKVVDFYFESSHFNEAAEIYCLLINNGRHTQTIFEKAGFAFLQLAKYDDAIEMFKKAELFESTTWINLKIAQCYTKKGNYSEALFYLKEAEKIDPDNSKIQLQIANTYLSMEEVDTALSHYFKLELLTASNPKVMRPISWCLFVLGRFEEAENYFNNIISSNQFNKYDLMNYGHLLLATGRDEQATTCYLKCIQLKGNSFEDFLHSFYQDKKHLLKHGVSEETLNFILEYIRMNK